MTAIERYDQATVDRLCQAVAWAAGNEVTATRLAQMSVEESGHGSPEPTRRGKVLGILRDALRQKSMGVIEEIPEKGLVKYAKPAGVIASLIPVTSPYVTPDRHRDLRDQVQGRGRLLPAPREPEDDQRGRAPDARSAAPAGSAGRHPAVHRAAQHSARERAHVEGRPHHRDRRSGDGESGVRLGQAGLRRRRRQRDDGHRRDCRHRRRGAQHAHQQDQRQRVRLFGRRQPAGRRRDLRRLPRGAAERRRLPGQRARESAAARRVLGRRRPPHRRRRSRGRRRPVAERAGFALPPGQDVLHRPRAAHRPAAPVLDREARDGARHLQIRRVRRRARQGAADLRDRRQGAFLRDLFVRRRAHPCPGAGGPGQPDHGAADPVARQCRHVHQRHADDLEHGLRRSGAATSPTRTSRSSTT